MDTSQLDFANAKTPAPADLDYDNAQVPANLDLAKAEEPGGGLAQAGKRVVQAFGKGTSDTIAGAVDTNTLIDRAIAKGINWLAGPDKKQAAEAHKELANAPKGKPSRMLKQAVSVSTTGGKVKEAAQKTLPQEIDKQRGYTKGLPAMVENAATGFSEFAPTMAATAVNPVAGATATFEQMFEGKKNELLKQGVNKKRAETSALLNAAVSTPAMTAGELFQIGAFKNLAGRASNRALGYVTSLIQGGLSGASVGTVQHYINALTDVYAHAPKGASVEDMVDVAKKTLASDRFAQNLNESAATGGIQGMILPAVGVARHEGTHIKREVQDQWRMHKMDPEMKAKYQEDRNNPGISRKELDAAYSGDVAQSDNNPASDNKPLSMGDLDKAFGEGQGEPNGNGKVQDLGPIPGPQDGADSHLSDKTPGDQLPLNKGIIAPADAMNSGMSLEQYQQQQQTNVEAGQTVNRIRMAQAERQKQMDQQRADQARQQYEAKVQAQRNDALQQEKIAAAKNQQFLNDLHTPQGIMDRASETAYQMEQSNNPQDKAVGKALRALHKALATGQHDPQKLGSLQYDLNEAVQHTDNLRAHALKGAMDEVLPKVSAQYEAQQQAQQPKVEPAQVSREIGANKNARAELKKAAAEKAKAAKGEPKKVKLDYGTPYEPKVKPAAPKAPEVAEPPAQTASARYRKPGQSVLNMSRNKAIPREEGLQEKEDLRRQVISHTQSGKFKTGDAVRFTNIPEAISILRNNRLESKGHDTVYATEIKGKKDDLFPNYGTSNRHSVAIHLPKEHFDFRPGDTAKAVEVPNGTSADGAQFLLPGESKPMTADEFKQRLMEDHKAGRYRLAPEDSKALQAGDELDAWANKANQEISKSYDGVKGNDAIKVIRSMKDAPEDLQGQMKQDKAKKAMAAYHKGTIYVFADQHPNMLEVKRSVWHELGHHSFADLFGKDGQSLLTQMGIKNRSEINKRLDDIHLQKTPENIRREAEEMLIDKFLANEKNGLVDKFKLGIRDLAKKIGFDVNTEFRHADARRLAERMRNNLLADKAVVTTPPQVESPYKDKGNEQPEIRKALFRRHPIKGLNDKIKKMWPGFIHSDAEYVNMLKEVHKANPKARDWYDAHQKTVEDTFGKDADLFNVLLGVTSPQAPVDLNAWWAVKSYLYLLGKEDRPGGMYPNSLAEGKLDKWFKSKDTLLKSLESPQHKVSEFIRALLGDQNATVNDRWLRRILFGENKGGKDDSKFTEFENTAARHKILQLAKQMTKETGEKWKPRQVQAALWSKAYTEANKIDASKIENYETGLNKARKNLNGMTPLEYMADKMDPEVMKSGALADRLGFNTDVEYPQVSQLEKKRLQHMADGEVSTTKEISVDDNTALKRYIQELKQSPQSHELIIPKDIREFKQAIKDGSRVFLTDNKKAGYVLDSSGDIQKVFNNSDVPGLGTNLLVDAIANGGRTLDCFEPYLPKFYRRVFGFTEKPVDGRFPFNPEYAPKNWPYQDYGDGSIQDQPDVVMMELTPDALKRLQNGKGKLTDKSIRASLGGSKNNWFREHVPGKLDEVRNDGGNVEGDVRQARPGVDQEASGAADQAEQGAGHVLKSGPKNFAENDSVPNTSPKYRMPDEERDHLISHIGPSEGKETINNLKMDVLDKVRTNIADSLHPLRKLEQQWSKQTGRAVPADMSGYKSQNMMSNFPSILGAFLHNGRVKAEDGWIGVTPDKEGGLFHVVKDLGDNADGFFKWMTANSAQEMLDKGREHLFGLDKKTGDFIDDQKMVQALKEDTDVMYTTNKDQFDKARDRLRDINTSVLDFAEHAGLIDPEMRKDWERFDYIPFYRVFDKWTDGSVESLFPKGGPDVGKIYQLKGSKRNMGDPMSNLISSYAYLLNESLKNVSRKKSMALASDLGLLEETNPGPKEYQPKNAINIRVKGKSKFFKVNDPMLYDALNDVDDLFQGGLSKWLSLPKKLFTYGVTFAPGFRAANLFRDTLQTSVLQKSFVPFVDSARGLYHALLNTNQMKEYEATGGAFSGAYHSRDTEANTKKAVDRLKRRLKKGETKGRYMNPLHLWDYLGEASENAARLGLYMKMREQGKSKFEAGYEAKDLLDFHRTGKSKLLRLATTLIPFLNARIQGLDKIGRSSIDPATRANFWTQGLLLGAVSTAVHYIYHKDQRYRDLTDAQRLNYMNFFDVPGLGHVKLPVPFEVGSAFMVWPQAMMEAAAGERDNPLGFTGELLSNIFAMNPVTDTQIIKPWVEQWANKDSFTGLPIVPDSMNQLDPDMQYDQHTSKTARAAGKAMEWFKSLPPEYKSPKRIDKLMQDYLGYMGQFITYGTDKLIFNHFYPPGPAQRIGDMYISGIGRFIKGEGEVPSSIESKIKFYNMLQEVDRRERTLQAHKRFRNRLEMKRYYKAHLPELRQAKELDKYAQLISIYNNQIKILLHSNKSPEDKRAKLDEIITKQNGLFRKALDRVKEE